MKSLGLVLIGLLFASPSYAAGVGSSGGGLAVVCRDSYGSITGAELLDLYEGTTRDHLTLVSPLNSLEAEYLYFTQELRHAAGDPRPVDQSVIDEFNELINGSLNFLPQGQHLVPACALGPTIPAPPMCDIEQLADYNDQTNVIDVDSEIWSALDYVNQGAFLAHETLDRTACERGSENVRRLVAQLFSTTPPSSEAAGVSCNNDLNQVH
jgi:hypothetical protein